MSSDSGGLQKKTATQFGTYLLASTLGTAAHYMTLFFLVDVFSLKPLIATTCGAILGAAVIYYLNYFYVFNSKKPHTEAAMKFFLVGCFSIFLNATVFKILTSISEWHYLILQLFTTGCVFTGTFILNRNWTFKVQSSSRSYPQ